MHKMFFSFAVEILQVFFYFISFLPNSGRCETIYGKNNFYFSRDRDREILSC